MKEKKLLQIMAVLDNDLIENANPAIKQKSKTNWLRFGTIAASLVLVAALSLTAILLFRKDNITTPPPIVQNDYESIYNILNRIKENNTLNNDLPTNTPPTATPDVGTTGGTGNIYQEVTDNQVNGVVEGDLLKRTKDYIFYLSNNSLVYYKISNDDTVNTTAYYLYDMVEVEDGGKAVTIYTRELYLSSDGKTATIIFYYNKEVKVVTLELTYSSNVTAKKKSEFTVKGNLISSRMADGKLILLTEYSVPLDNMKKNDPESYVPVYDKGSGYEPIPCCCIISPFEPDVATYKVLTVLEENGLDHIGTMAFLSYSATWYVTKESIYLTYRYTETKSIEPTPPYTKETHTDVMTSITKVSYTNGELVSNNTATVKGSLNNQYSLDEYEGILRVFTSIRHSIFKEQPYDKTPGFGSTTSISSVSASLYCIDTNTMKVCSSVEEFAPQGETVKSARFDKNMAYVCTAVGLTDPVFYFDLTDIYNITYKNTDTIPGFSSSLKPLGNGYLLGFGTDGKSSDAKVEIYREVDDGIEVAGTLYLPDTNIPTYYKAYYIDTKNRLIGFPCYEYLSGQKYYYVLRYEILNNGLVIIDEIAQESIPNYNLISEPRGVFIDGRYYIVAVGKMTAFKVDEAESY